MSRRSVNRKAARHAARRVEQGEQLRLVRRSVGLPLRTTAQSDQALALLSARKQARADRLLVRVRAELKRTVSRILRTVVDDGRPRTAAILAAARAYAA